MITLYVGDPTNRNVVPHVELFVKALPQYTMVFHKDVFHNATENMCYLRIDLLLKKSEMLYIESSITNKVFLQKNKKSDNVVSGITLCTHAQDGICEYRNALKHAKEFLNSDGECPSGTNEEDLLLHVRKKRCIQSIVPNRKEVMGRQ